MALRFALARAPRLLLLVALTACARVSAPAYHGPTSDHFDGERFHNYVPFHDSQLDDALRRTLSIITGGPGGWPEWEEVRPDVPPYRVGVDASDSTIRVTFVNHSTALLQTHGLNILTDPIWSERASPFSWVGPKRHRPPGIRFEDLPPIDVVLLSHDHYDHLDVPTLHHLVDVFHPRIICGLGVAAFLARQGIHGAQEIDWWQSVHIAPGVDVTGVPAQHWSARWIGDKWRTLWLGYVIETPAGRIYFAGDTGFGDFFSMIHQRFSSFRLALLPIAPGRPRKTMAPRHLSAGDAVRVYRLLDVSTAVAIHFGTFQQGSDSEREPVDSLHRAIDGATPCDVRFWALRNGESRLVPIGPPLFAAARCSSADTSARRAVNE